ncbi:hypothetical protein THOM_3249, partial [Trachipleistophora hominis]
VLFPNTDVSPSTVKPRITIKTAHTNTNRVSLQSIKKNEMIKLMNILHLISTTTLFTFVLTFSNKKKNGKKEPKDELVKKDDVILQPSFGIFDNKNDKTNKNHKDDNIRDTFKDSDKIAPIFTKDKRDDKKESDDKDKEKEISNEIMTQSSYKPPMVTMLLNKNKKEDERKEQLAEYDQMRPIMNDALKNLYSAVSTMDKLANVLRDDMKKGEEKKMKSSAPEERIDYKIIEVTDNDGK